MPEMRQMHANLMRASRLQPALDEAGEGARLAAVALQHAISRARRLALAADNGHALAVERVAADVAFDDSVAGPWRAPRRRMVGALDGAGGKLLGKARHGAVVLRCHNESTGVLVQPMHDAWPRHAAHAGQRLAAMGNQ